MCVKRMCSNGKNKFTDTNLAPDPDAFGASVDRRTDAETVRAAKKDAVEQEALPRSIQTSDRDDCNGGFHLPPKNEVSTGILRPASINATERYIRWIEIGLLLL